MTITKKKLYSQYNFNYYGHGKEKIKENSTD